MQERLRGVMMSDNILKLHISAEERKRWNKAVANINDVISGIIELPPGNGMHRGSSMNDFSNDYKNKLDSIEWGANKYIHPPTHPASMITGLAQVAVSGDYNHLINRPTHMIADGGNCDTINGIRITMGPYAPGDPQVNRVIWFSTNDKIIRIFTERGWEAMHAVWA